MLYLAIPAQNEVATIGVLLWRLRTVLAEFPREYEVVVYDDASSDETADVAEQYANAMPVTVLRGTTAVGYAGAVDALVRYVSGHTRYPRRDAMLLLQADFTDPPGIVPEFARRFEGGADVVVGERTAVVDAPTPVKRLFSAAGWALRPFVTVNGVRDLTGSMRLVRISVLRDALRSAGTSSVCEGDSWTANADLLLRLVPHARRVESVPMEPTYGVRMRDTRRVTVRDALAALRWGWRARGRRAAPTTVPESSGDAMARPARGAAPAAKRRDEPEVTAERLRERKRDRDRPRSDSGLEDATDNARREKGRRDRREARVEADTRSGTSGSTEMTPATRETREDRTVRAKTVVHGAPASDSRQARGVPRATAADQDPLPLDPFSPPTSRIAPSPSVSPSASPQASSDQAADTPLPRETGRPRRKRGRSRATAASDAANDAPNSTPDDAAIESGTASSPRPDAGDASEPLQRAESRRSENAARDTSDIDADAETGETEPDLVGEQADETDANSRDRKRRRNRRSRRRKSQARDDGAQGAETAEGHVAAPESNDERPPATNDRSAREAVGRTRESTAEPSEALAAADGGDDDGGCAEGDGASELALAKRRGRRGRRGGARRSRNRDRIDQIGERPDTDAGASPGDGPSGADD